MKQALFLIVLLSLAGRLWAVSEALFTSVTGKVEIKGHKGHMLRIAHKDVTVVEGERIITGANAQATLQTFDGSEIQISPNTDVWMEKLRKPDANDKVIQFKMEMGQLMAQVKHLFSAQSSFEISAGGVVCGVRGTQYQVKYDPSTHTVYLGVLDGTVYAGSNGQTRDYGKGSSEVFRNGVPVGGANNGIQGETPEGKTASIFADSLDEMEDQFQVGLPSNDNRLFTDPSVEGSVRVKLSANISAGEDVP
jgi:hypothetical protein